MTAAADKRIVSVGLVFCMITASVAIMICAVPASGTVYQSPLAYVDGNETMQNLGRSVALVDLNADGIADLVVGAPYTTAGGLRDSGAVTIYLSDSGAAMTRTVVINGTNLEDLFGWTVVNVGDVNGDGRPDLAIGSPLADPAGAADAGNITLIYGWTGFDGVSNATIAGTNAGEELGFSIAAAGDINGDGMDDILAGAPFYGSGPLTGSGRAYVFYGGNPPNSVSDKTYTGEVGGAHLGWSIAGGGSVDADADLDMIAGAPGQGSMGAAYIVRDLSKANPTVTVTNGRSADENFSFSVSMVPDINGDTIADIAIGAPTNNDNGTHAGAVYVLYGGSKFNTVADITLVGAPNEWFGWAVTSGDFHQDGISDLLVGAPNSNLNTSSSGRAYAYFGGTVPSSWPNITLVPGAGASFFGASLATGGNMTGDIAPDFAVGDPLFNVPGIPNAGRVYVYAGTHIVIPANPIVKGYVYVPGTTQGIQGFTVSLESATLNKSTTTNAAGYFQMTAIPGTFWLNASKVGYVANASTVTLVMNDNLTVPPFYPLKTPTVSGVIRDVPTGALIQGAIVAMYNGSIFIEEMDTGTNGTYWFSVPNGFVPAVGSSINLTIRAWDATHYTSTAGISLMRNQTVLQNLLLDKFPVVSGSVREALFLSAVRGALVQANQGPTIITTTTTDIRGMYSLLATNASAGQPLYVNVTASGYWRTNGSVLVDKNGTYSLNFILQPDNTPPTSQLDALSEYSTASTVSLGASASDANGIQEVQLWYRMGTSGSYQMYGAITSSPYTFSFDPSAAGGDGLYSFYSIAIDYAGNAESAPAGNDTWTFADSHAPTISITLPTPGQLLHRQGVLAGWTGSDIGSGIQKYDVQLDTDGWIDVGVLPIHMFTPVADGPHNISVRATDRAGLASTATVGFEVDSTNATSYVDALPAYTASDTFTVNVTATDLNGIDEVQLWFRYGGSGSFEFLGADTSAPYRFEFNSSEHAGDGLYEFYSLALDGAGNNETAPSSNDTWTIVDTAPPTVSIVRPETSSTVGDPIVVVNWTGADTSSGIGHYDVRIDGGAWVACDLSLNYAFGSTSDGNHTIDVMAVDRAGHTATASSTFAVDTVLPTVSIDTPQDDSASPSLTILMRWTAHDNGSGIATVSVSRDGVNYESVNVTSSEYTFSAPSGLREGEYTLYVRAFDFGGLSATASVVVMLDRTPPTATISSPLSGEKVDKSSTTVSWMMADALSGIAQVRISVDDGAFQSIGIQQSYELTTLADGEHNVTIRISDNAGNTKDVSVTFTVSTGGGMSSVMLATIAVIVIVAIMAAALLMKRRKPSAIEPPKTGGKS